MKIVIIGGGVAGLTLAALLLEKEHEVVVFERAEQNPKRGHAFLMREDGLAILKKLSHTSNYELPVSHIKKFSLRDIDNTEKSRLKLSSWNCIRRVDLIHFLSEILPKKTVKFNKTFSHFKFKKGIATAAVFNDGHIEYGDIFIGADGKNSLVRKNTHGPVEFTKITVKEVVGCIVKKINTKQKEAIFQKYQDTKNKIAFGVIPTANSGEVWFIQYACKKRDIQTITPASLKEFCYELTKDFPKKVKDTLDANDFSSTYVWDTFDFDLLPSFHKNNIALIGDAAHLAVPFTSAGTTNAIIDAQTLTMNIEEADSIEKAFENYYKIRAKDIKNHIKLGRTLKSNFLNPNKSKTSIPLIQNIKKQNTQKKNNTIQLTQYTDPICSTCWVFMPVMRKLMLEYGEYIEVTHKMSGLLPSWKNFDRGGIKTPYDVAKHWDEVGKASRMPLNYDVWHKDILHSSYPPSIAVKAAQIQDKNKALLFMRNIQELLFVYGKNISKQNYIVEAALNSGLDSALLLTDMKSIAKDNFNADLAESKKLKIQFLPTLVIKNKKGKEIRIAEIEDYKKLENIILRLNPLAKKYSIKNDPELIFSKFNSVTEKEFEYITGCSEAEAKKTLMELYKKGIIKRKVSRNGILWIYNLPNL